MILDSDRGSCDIPYVFLRRGHDLEQVLDDVLALKIGLDGMFLPTPDERQSAPQQITRT